MDFIGGIFDTISQALKDLAKAIGDFLFGDDKEEGQEEWKKEEVVTEIMGHEGMETEPPVISARVRCTCCIDPVSEVYVFPRQNNNVSQAKKQQLNHKDTTLMPPVFSGCTNTPGNVCTVKILDDIWFAPDESIEVGDGYALNEEMSYMVCLTGVGMIYLSDSGQVIESMEDRLVDELLNRIINKEAFRKMGWSDEFTNVYGEDVFEELKRCMKKYGIINSVSIAMFLATLNVESGRGEYRLEYGGADESRYFKVVVNYSGDVRGAGLIQLTGGDQKAFLKDISKGLSDDDPMKATVDAYINGYSTDGRDNTYKDANGRTAAEFIADEYSVESAAWYWGGQEKINKGGGDTESLNDFAVEHADDNQHNTFAATQMAVNGTPYSGAALDRFSTSEKDCEIKSDSGCTEQHTGNYHTGYCFTLEEGPGDNRHDYGPRDWEKRETAYKNADNYIKQNEESSKD